MQQRRKFSEEFKREAVSLARQPDANVAQIAEELGIGAELTDDSLGDRPFAPGIA